MPHRELSPGLVEHALLQAQLVHERREVSARAPPLRGKLLRAHTAPQRPCAMHSPEGDSYVNWAGWCCTAAVQHKLRAGRLIGAWFKRAQVPPMKRCWRHNQQQHTDGASLERQYEQGRPHLSRKVEL